MKNLTILVDTNEKDLSIQKELTIRGIPFKRYNLDFGDYSFEYEGVNYEKRCVVERKNSINEIVGNFTKGRRRFENEFKRAEKAGAKMYLMIEASQDDIENKNYISRMGPVTVKSYLATWCYKFGLTLNFVKKEEATDFILDTFEKFLDIQN